MKAAYPAIVHKEDGMYWVEFPDLPGCFSDGETKADAIENAREAVALYLNALEAQNIKAPAPSQLPDGAEIISCAFEKFVG